MQYERRDSDLTPELRMSDDATQVVGYAAVFNQYSKDLGGFVERIQPGAFKRVLNRGDDVFALFNHSMDNLLATRSAGTLRLAEDDRGLRYEFDLDASDPDHQRVISKVRRGDLRGSSFGFRASADEWGTTEQDYPLRDVTEVGFLRDVGPVTAPAYPDTSTDATRLALRSLSEAVDIPLDELVEAAASDLRGFLIAAGHQDEASAHDAEDAATAESVADSPDERNRWDRVMPFPKWHDLASRYEAE